MAIVTSLQFSQTSGAIMCDEEYWYLRRRRSFFLDNFRNVIPEDISSELEIYAGYGGWGHPGFHEEVIRRTREGIREYWNDGKKEDLRDLETIARIIRNAMDRTRRRKIDDLLTYLYGFNLDDLNRGSFEEHGETVEIKQSAVLEAAKALATFKTQNHLTNPIFKNKCVFAGYDPKWGFRGWHINAENTVYSLISGGFEAIGAGLYGAGIEFSRILNRLTLDQRREGFDPVWGLIALMEATLNAWEHFHEVGGGLHLILIDGTASKKADRYREVTDRPMQLAKEMITAVRSGLCTYATIYPLINELIYKKADPQKIEKKFIDSAADTVALKKLLRGYKFYPYPDAASTGSRRRAKKEVK